jgi:hypothetical protein
LKSELIQIPLPLARNPQKRAKIMMPLSRLVKCSFIAEQQW